MNWHILTWIPQKGKGMLKGQGRGGSTTLKMIKKLDVKGCRKISKNRDAWESILKDSRDLHVTYRQWKEKENMFSAIVARWWWLQFVTETRSSIKTSYCETVWKYTFVHFRKLHHHIHIKCVLLLGQIWALWQATCKYLCDTFSGMWLPLVDIYECFGTTVCFHLQGNNEVRGSRFS